jgi:hypothetical protein
MGRRHLSRKPHSVDVSERAEGQATTPTAALFDSATGQCTAESRRRAGYDGHKKRKDSIALDTRGHCAGAAEVVKLPAAKRGVIVPSRRWVVDRLFARVARVRACVERV